MMRSPQTKPYVLDNGEIIYEGPARELAKDEARVQSLAGASAEEWTIDEADSN